MAEYTIELREIVEHGIPVFDFPYVFYDEAKRSEFEEKFIRHFYFREIGCETVERFKWYLQDKMNVVFPFYNELLKTALIEYDKLYNYDMTETYTKNIESVGKQHGISSTVGQLMGEQESETKQDKTVDTIGTFDSVGTDSENETGNSTTATDENSSSDIVKKFLDTPQGLTDLTDSKYLTTLNQDTAEGSANGTTDTETSRNATKNATVEQDTTGKETTVDNVTGTLHNEQKTTTDNNTKMYNDSKQSESYTLARKGNIGVQTGSDMIEKHIELQKKLQKIEKMFFDECEDLFMLVY